jgi:hypothetical protein
MKPEGSLPHSQVPATYPYPEPARSSPCPHIPHPADILLILCETVLTFSAGKKAFSQKLWTVVNITGNVTWTVVNITGNVDCGLW